MNVRRFLAGLALAVAACLSAAPAFAAGGPAYPTRVPTLATLQGYTAAQMALYGSFLLDEQIAGNANGSTTYLWESSWSATPDGQNVIAPSDNPSDCSVGCLVATGVLTVKSGLESFTVASSGGNYTTANAAIADLGTKFFGPNVQLTVTVNDGTYSEPGADQIFARVGGALNLTSQHSYSTTVTSMQSSSGSAGAWTLVFNVASGANISVGNYVGIYGAANGTNPTYLDGCFPVTGVSGNQITVTSAHQASSAPSGSVTANVDIFRSVLSYTGTDGIDIWNGAAAIQLFGNIAIVGNGTGDGLSVQDVGRLYIGGNVCVADFNNNVVALLNSEINSNGRLYEDGGAAWGAEIGSGSTLNSSIIANGNASGGSWALNGSSIVLGTNSTSTGNVGNGNYATQNSTFVADNSQSTGNGASAYGFAAATQSFISVNSTTGGGNGAGDYSTAFSTSVPIKELGSTINSGFGANGFLGINTSLPSHYFDTEATTAGTGYAWFLNDATRTGTDTVVDITGSGANENLSLLANGTLEIGTTSCSSYILCIAGGVDISGGNNLTVTGEIIQNTQNGGIVLTSTNVGASAYAVSINDATRTTTDDVFHITGSGSNENFDILAGGCVEIGTTGCSGYLLDVNGNATITGTFTAAAGAINLNASSNNAVNINTGTSTGTTTIGNTGTLGTLVLAGVGSDTGKSDATVCDVTSTYVIYYGSGTGGICLTTSARDTKRDIHPLTAGLREILAVEPEQFYYKSGFGDDGKRLQFGYIADEVQPILPTLVGHDSRGKPNSVDYGGFVPVLVHAFQQEYAWIAGKFGLIESEIHVLWRHDAAQDREIETLRKEVIMLGREHAHDNRRLARLERLITSRGNH